MSDQYDDTNRGVAFPPFENQAMILQGKLNIAGKEERIALVKNTTRNGKNLIEVYQKVGVLFPNKSENENAPHFTGPLVEAGCSIEEVAKRLDRTYAATAKSLLKIFTCS